MKMDDRRCLVDVRPSRPFDRLEGFRLEFTRGVDIVVIVWSYEIVGEKDICERVTLVERAIRLVVDRRRNGYLCGGNVDRVVSWIVCSLLEVEEVVL